MAGLPFVAHLTPSSDHERNVTLQQREDPHRGHVFHGINWLEADKDDVCSKEQRNILVQTVINVDKYARELVDAPLMDNPAWERFMGGRKKDGVSQPRTTWFVSDSIT